MQKQAKDDTIKWRWYIVLYIDEYKEKPRCHLIVFIQVNDAFKGRGGGGEDLTFVLIGVSEHVRLIDSHFSFSSSIIRDWK